MSAKQDEKGASGEREVLAVYKTLDSGVQYQVMCLRANNAVQEIVKHLVDHGANLLVLAEGCTGWLNNLDVDQLNAEAARVYSQRGRQREKWLRRTLKDLTRDPELERLLRERLDGSGEEGDET